MDDLATIEPFTHLPPAERRRLAQVSREKRYVKGETVFRAGEASDAVWLVKSGRVHLMEFLVTGKTSTTCVMAEGDVFCCLPALDRKPYPADAVAAAETTLLRIPAAAFQQAMARSPAFNQRAVCLFCERLRNVEHKCALVYEPAERRLATVLLNLTKQFGLTVPLTRQELAEMAGTTHETAIRVLSIFKKQGLVRSSRGKTTVLSAEKLAALLK